ncbi:SCO6880 family protein [Pengzhenrongella phosphoraccumulans]|uniref:SCO6880 family protein n=1 Tax=Pengzhenrongella phosphoraccumulans TaxID=3114394 RepID=UPI00388EE97B
MTIAPARPTENGETARTVRFGRRSSRGVLLGLSTARVTAIGVALLVAVPAVYLGGMSALVWTAPAWGSALGLAFVWVGGRRAVEWVPVYGHWVLRRARGQNIYGVRVLRPRPAGTLALPGDAACLRFHHDTLTGAAMIHDPYANTLTAVAKVRHPSFVLLAPGDQDRRVAGWGRVLATCCASGRIARVQILERTLPDSGHGVRQHWRDRGRRDGSWSARQYDELVEQAGPAAERHETTISISLDMTRTRRAVRAEGGGVGGAAAVLRRELATVVAALRAADITVDGWVEPDDLAVMLRLAYDPGAAQSLDRTGVGRNLEAAGPVAVHEHFDHLRTDSGVHAVYWISEWPRYEVYPSFLSSILLAAGVRRATSIVAHPLTTAEAMRSVRKERVEYQTDAAQRQRIGQIADFGAEQEWADVTQRERDLVAGHGDLRYAGFLCVTAPDLDSLQAARSAIEQAAVQAGCETRLLLGQQAQAFTAAALPLARGI